MTCGKNVKERTARIGRKVKPLSAQLAPRDVLPDYKEQSEGESDVEPAGRMLRRTSDTAHVCGDAPPPEFKSHAAGEQHYSIQVKNGRQCEMLPVHSSASANN